jgi:hypothetical protein
MNKSKIKCRLLFSATAFLLLLAAVELVLRYKRFDEFWIYQTDPEIGYILAPSQSGMLCGIVPWFTNERSMQNSSTYVPDPQKNILLVGDSLVWGGTPMWKPSERLGALLQADAGGKYRIYPAAAGSWSVLNEITYINRQKDIWPSLRGIVIVSNNGDFWYRTEWSSELTHPRSRPWLVSLYLVEKKFFTHLPPDPTDPGYDSSIKPSVKREETAWLESLDPEFRSRITFVWYPDKAEFEKRSAATASLVNEVKTLEMKYGCRFYDVENDPRWKLSFYKDGIHPNLEGNKVLAQIIAGQLP